MYLPNLKSEALSVAEIIAIEVLDGGYEPHYITLEKFLVYANYNIK